MIEKICKWCNENIIVEKHIYFAQHISKCPKNPNVEIWSKNSSELNKGKQLVERLTIKKVCLRCNNDFELTGTFYQLNNSRTKKYCSDKCARARPQTKETKEKISHSINYGGKWINRPKGNNGIKYGNGHSKKLINGTFKGGFGKAGWYKRVSCDSSWELAFLIYSLENNLEIIRNKEGFEYYHNNIKHDYFPDFIINNIFYEIKGFLRENDKSKFDYFPHELILIDKEKINPYLDYTISKYGKDFINLYDGNPHNKLTNSCLTCGNPCKQKNKYCSRVCGGKRKR